MRIAVIGAGISGLAAAYFLSRRHQVSLIEREPRLGGHTHTVSVADDDGIHHLDTGFLVHNHVTYPHLVRLFQELQVETRKSDMSFSVSCTASGREYSSRGLRGFFAQPSRLASPEHYRLLWQITRFNRIAPVVLQSDDAGVTLGDYLAAQGFDDDFRARYLLPMTSAIWSASAADVETFPVTTIVRFLHNHGMLSTGRHPDWYVVRGGSCSYVPKLVAPLGSDVHTGATLSSITRQPRGVRLAFANREPMTVDHAVLACHGDQVLPLLADPSDLESDVFSRFSTTTNDTWLHTDASFLPSTAGARASWNYRLGSRDSAPSVTYHLNRLQGLCSRIDYCVTLNPATPPPPERVILRKIDRHPKLDAGAVEAQGRWREVSGPLRTHYCGAYWRYGFHEDGLWSALRVANDLGVTW